MRYTHVLLINVEFADLQREKRLYIVIKRSETIWLRRFIQILLQGVKMFEMHKKLT